MPRKIAILIAACILITFWAPLLSTAAAPQDLAGRIVILDAGHGQGNSPGYAGYIEHTTMLKLANKIKPLLEARGATVYMTRQTEEDVSLYVRAALVNKWALEAVRDAKETELESAEGNIAKTLRDDIAEIGRLLGIVQKLLDDPETYAPIYLNIPFDYTYKRKIHPDWQKVLEYENHSVIQERFFFISLHSNATPAPIDNAANGAVVYYASNTNAKNINYYANYSYESNNHYFGNALLNNIVPLGIKRKSLTKEHWLVIREHNIPGVLAENGFHTNAQDRAKLSDDAFLTKLASVYDKTTLDYFTNYVGPIKETEPKEETVAEPSPPDDTAPESEPLASASAWARNAIESAIEKGFIPQELQNGYAKVISFAEFCKIAISYIEYAKGQSVDTLTADPALAAAKSSGEPDLAILAAGALGIAMGTGLDGLKADEILTREQAAAMLMHICRILDKITEDIPPCGFTDLAAASGWAIEGIEYCAANGIMNGTGGGLFNPKGTFTKEQCIQTLINMEK